MDALNENYIYCENHRCTISKTGCLKRQARAKAGPSWNVRGVVRDRSGSKSLYGVPYDEKCLDCEQGRRVAGENPKVKKKSKVEKPETKTKKIKTENGPVEIGFKRCSKCGEIKRLSDFHKSSITSDGRYPSCKDCRKQQNAEQYRRRHKKD